MLTLPMSSAILNSTDDFSENPGPWVPPSSSIAEFRDHYRVIGQTLEVGEANFFTVGIPWLLPTERVTKLRESNTQDFEDFFRANFSTASTASLELYAEDLEAVAQEKKLPFELTLTELLPMEQFGLLGLLTGIGFFAVFLSVLFLLGTFVVALLSATLIGVMLSLLAYPLFTQTFRLASFHRVISEEIMRRKGFDGNTQKIKRFLFATPKPL